jgi:hypothetical protein
MKAIRKYLSELREHRAAVIANQAAILDELKNLTQAVTALNENVIVLANNPLARIERIGMAAESLVDMQRAVLSQSHPHLVR